jgi:hypothetical protein
MVATTYMLYVKGVRQRWGKVAKKEEVFFAA